MEFIMNIAPGSSLQHVFRRSIFRGFGEALDPRTESALRKRPEKAALQRNVLWFRDHPDRLFGTTLGHKSQYSHGVNSRLIDTSSDRS